MFARTISTLALAAVYASATSASALQYQPADSHAALPKRCGGCGGYGGIGGYGGFGGFGGCGFFPFASSVTNDFDRCSNCANFNEHTLFTNNKCANCANDNVHCCNSANVIA
ncbi:hypothetical protein GGI20_005564 [Coemansia sp. BCRC 34301]|nr:hypothetical protein GGI20_005564 [Coemansia sp. BCRC 34301]